MLETMKNAQCIFFPRAQANVHFVDSMVQNPKYSDLLYEMEKSSQLQQISESCRQIG